MHLMPAVIWGFDIALIALLWWLTRYQRHPDADHCHVCGVRLTIDEKAYYGGACLLCVRSDFHHKEGSA